MTSTAGTYRLPPNAAPSSSGSDTDDLDDGCSDWASSFGEARRTKSLFDDTVHASPELAMKHDASLHRFDLDAVCKDRELDMYGRIRLVNLIRRDGLNPDQVSTLGKEWMTDDSLLPPVIADDPLLQFGFDSWSDEDEEPASAQVQHLQKELAAAQALLQQTMADDLPSTGEKKRDDDSHYFDSYAENDIHEIMLKDTQRTVSYARFILSNPAIFKDAVVMDVGCGTGILSMFAAKAGAKKVYAIEASGLASKARENIKNNGLEQIITVIQSKVEDIKVEREVDVVISEWMGYALLYESMLDSVLYARDHFMKEGGLMAPSQTAMKLVGITGERLWKERIDFWQSVYGFNMTAMDKVYYDEGLVEVVDAAEVLTSEAVVRNIDTHTATPKSLDFHSSFTLKAESTGSIRAFLTYFDTFFSPVPGQTFDSVDLSVLPTGLANVEPVAPGVISFTTGPRGKETHWRQVAFLLKTPIELTKGDELRGRFYCRKSSNNSRELDVEIHYEVGGETRVQLFKVR
ncbi:S-adenosyl-L-methionine-dependent methyltransferase [Dioszegia hungarica]|uniref:type I protein arginine methyltransferase n=1 Tax=Dioszegia hungarica TaxID=4972 RepID=A0AA38HCG7_9TREE|nr:S-adenosyl-L-methionine-dependent methyltransferase [Dioszegia hungarica]KAI9638963.1 S-adenosyl-L-methionine-dependent methyltransferase [Dioszegia hungarica]